jgi:hypothetical protein
MVTLDRIRLTGLLTKSPAQAGLFYLALCFSCKLGRLPKWTGEGEVAVGEVRLEPDRRWEVVDSFSHAIRQAETAPSRLAIEP